MAGYGFVPKLNEFIQHSLVDLLYFAICIDLDNRTLAAFRYFINDLLCLL